MNIPDIPGLKEWKAAFPTRIMHSKRYRQPDPFRNQNVVLVGAGVSSTDIAKEIGPVAKSVTQVSRGGQYDLPSAMLPPNGSRVGAIERFDLLQSGTSVPVGDQDTDVTGPIPGTITLQSGEKLCNVDTVILCTGYHVSLPFLKEFHADGVEPADADDKVLVTNGQHTHNLHKDIFYIPDPTLAFIGVPYHVATFSLFDHQAMALAAVFSGKASLPSETEMRSEYQARLETKGAGREFHSLKALGAEGAYVEELVSMTKGSPNSAQSTRPMLGHSERWHSAYKRRVARMRELRTAVRSTEEERSSAGFRPMCV